MTTGPHPNPPVGCAFAFKEWAGICTALEDGSQTLILRKGGIAEGPSGFVPDHNAFWLYPTHVHQEQQGLRIPDRGREATAGTRAEPAADVVEIRALAVVATVDYVSRWETLEALEAFHIWTAETVRKRFAYRKPGVWVLGVRAFRRREAFRVAVTPEQLGCKTWVEVEPAPTTEGVEPVLTDSEFGWRIGRIRSLLGRGE